MSDRSAAPPSTVAELLEGRAGDESTGVVCGDRSWTWREVVDRSRVVATWLGGVRGDGPFHVGVLLDNTPDYLFALFGSALGGAAVVGVNSTRRGDELARDIGHTDCRLLITDREHAHLLDGLDLGDVPVALVDGPEGSGDHPSGDGGPAAERCGARAWPLAPGASVEPGAPVEPGVGVPPGAGVGLGRPATTVAPVGPDDLFVLIFTSGSTGAPKAVRMTHGRAASMADRSTWLGADDVLYSAMPLFHGNALNAIVLPALASGATIALRPRFSASQFMPDVRRYRATFFSTVGRALAYVLATPEDPADQDHVVKFALAPESSPADIRAFRERFGIPCFAGYGSSENAITMAPVPGMPKEALGKPPDDVDAAVVDPETLVERPRARFDADGRLVNADEAIGEIVGRNVVDRFEGYYRNPEADAERTRNGWYWSGDLGYRDEHGVFFFAGRSGEWLRVDAENFATAPVERIIGRYPDCRGVAVFAVPDERTADDQVMAALELSAGETFDPVAFGAFLDAQPDLGTKWAPRYLRVTTLPVTATNKVDKKPLRAERWNTTDPLFWREGREGAYRPFTAADRRLLLDRFARHGRDPDRP